MQIEPLAHLTGLTEAIWPSNPESFHHAIPNPLVSSTYIYSHFAVP